MAASNVEEYDEMIDEAIAICKDCSEVSPSLFEILLGVDLTRGANIFYQLKELGIISTEKYIQCGSHQLRMHLGVVDHDSIRKLSLN